MAEKQDFIDSMAAWVPNIFKRGFNGAGNLLTESSKKEPLFTGAVVGGFTALVSWFMAWKLVGNSINSMPWYKRWPALLGLGGATALVATGVAQETVNEFSGANAEDKAKTKAAAKAAKEAA